MRLHQNLVAAVAGALWQVIGEDQLSDRVCERLLQEQPKWGARDRAFAAGSLYSCVRWWRLLGWALAPEAPPAPVTPHEAWLRLGALLVREGHELPPWAPWEGPDWPAVAARLSPQSPELLALPSAVRQSVPDWLNHLGEKQLGPAWARELEALNGTAGVTLRVNSLRASPASLVSRLQGEGFETQPVPGLPYALQLASRRPVTRSHAYADGWFAVQDANSQRIAPLLRVQPGMLVVDACAGAGGKSLHLAALMRNEGHIVALDVERVRLDQLARRAGPAGASCIEPALVNPALLQRLRGRADRVLVDAPCSGLGTLRRQPDIKWRLTPQRLEELVQIQQQVLGQYSQLLKPGGMLVFATCSLLPLEGAEQVERFLEKTSGFQRLEEQTFLPSQSDSDGFYAALLQRG